MSEELVRQLASSVGGTIEEMQRLPDGSGFAVMSMPLPKDHWSVVNPDGLNEPPTPFRLGTEETLTTVNLTRAEFADRIRAAGRYAYRASTMNGKDTDLDPDALLQNLVVGMLGYWTPDGTSKL